MNLLLLYQKDLHSPSSAEVLGVRARTLIEQHELKVGLTLRAGVLGGKLGRATVVQLDDTKLTLDLVLDEDPPARLPAVVVVGVSRPQTVKKVIQAVTTLGAVELHFVRTELGEKSYLSSEVLEPQSIQEEIEKGLSQAIDTISPAVHVHHRFLPFIEDVLPQRMQTLGWSSTLRILADTLAPNPIPYGNHIGPWIVSVGPEIGWSAFERQSFLESGFLPASLGPRMLRVETAVTGLLSQISLLRNES